MKLSYNLHTIKDSVTIIEIIALYYREILVYSIELSVGNTLYGLLTHSSI